MAPGATVIVPTHRGAARIGSLLESLEAQGTEHQVLVVDNASTDGTADVLARHPEAQVLRPGANLGFGAAINLAAERAEGEALVLVNDDCVLDPGFVGQIAAPLGGDVVMAAGVLRDRHDPGLIDTAGMELDPTLTVFDYLHGEPLRSLDTAPDPVGPSAAAAAFDRSAFLESGGFDEALFAYWEDVDLVLRLALAGGRCALARKALGTHWHSATLGSGSRRKNELMGFGRGYVLRKWSVLRGSRALRAIAQDAVICAGQAAIDRTVSGVPARVRGYRRASERRPYPAAVLESVEHAGALADLRRRLRRRRRLRGARAPGADPERREIEAQLNVRGTDARVHGNGIPAARLTTPLPEQLRVGGGTGLLLGGTVEPPLGGRLSRLELLLDGEPSGESVHLLSDGASRGLWWSRLEVEPLEHPRNLRLELAVRPAAGESARSPLGELRAEPGKRSPAPSGVDGLEAAIRAGAAHGGPLVAICMATHQPQPELFRAQVESIASQAHGNWVCVICDDGSGADAVAGMADVLDDPRFVLIRNRNRLGFYGNYERALGLVPAEADFVALSDQDDAWDPDKLTALLGAIGDRSLVYSDMRVVDERGAIVSSTYWTARRNNHTDLMSLLVGNTVTGAASMFRAELLEYVLPFPPQRGRSYHDHWIALGAMLNRGIGYVDRPLMDYVQHAGASQGHAEANAGARYLRPAKLVPMAWHTVLALAGLRSRPGWARRYFGMFTRTVIWARTLQLRSGPSLDRRQRRVLGRVARAEESPLALAWFAARSLRPLWGANEAFGRELILVSSVVWCRALLARSRLALPGRRRAEALVENPGPMPADPQPALVAHRPEDK